MHCAELHPSTLLTTEEMSLSLVPLHGVFPTRFVAAEMIALSNFEKVHLDHGLRSEIAVLILTTIPQDAGRCVYLLR